MAARSWFGVAYEVGDSLITVQFWTWGVKEDGKECMSGVGR